MRLSGHGHDATSCDLLPTKQPGPHIQGNILEHLQEEWDLAIFHPMCTYLTCSAEWAYKDPDFERYPEIGYHQRVKPGTLTGEARRKARDSAEQFVYRLRDSGIPRIAIENPKGALSTRWRKPEQIIQPYDFGDDASKETCLWLSGLPALLPTARIPGRIVTDPKTGKTVERWSNQTDAGQNRESPSDDRWERRSKTYSGIAEAMAAQWGAL